MRIVSLNIWGGKLKDPLLSFFAKYSGLIDIFCLQEVFNNGNSTRHHYRNADMQIFNEISSVLPNHVGLFAPHQDHEEGLALFSNKHLGIIECGDVFVYRWKNAMRNNDDRFLGRNIQFISFYNNKDNYIVANFHGLWDGINRLDSNNRIAQSKNILAFLASRQEENKVLIGDFNLLPNTQSVGLLEITMKNLIKSSGILGTRTALNKEPEKHADYCFVSPNIHIKSFKLMQEVVSDHAPLYLEI